MISSFWVFALLALAVFVAGLAAPSIVNRWIESVPDDDDENEDEEFAEFFDRR